MSLAQGSPPNFFVQVVTLTGATAFGQILVLLTYPWLARLYSPAEFGVLGVFEASLGIALTVCTLRYHLAIPIPVSTDDAARLAIVAGAVLLGFVSIMALVVASAGDTLAAALHPKFEEFHLWLLIVAVLCVGSYLVLQSWQLRFNRIEDIARARLAQGCAHATTQVTFGLLHFSSVGLICGILLGRVAAIATLALHSDFRTHAANVLRVPVARIWEMARIYRRLPLWSSWSAIANTTGQELSVLAFGASFSVEFSGWYSLAFFLVMGPTIIVSQAIEQVFLSRIRASPVDHIGAAASRLYFTLFRALLAPCALFVLVAPELFATAFGEAWTEAGLCASALAVSALAAMLGAHLSSLVLIRHWLREEFMFNAALFLARCVWLWWATSNLPPLRAVEGYAILSASMIALYHLALMKAAGEKWALLLAVLGRETCIVAAAMSPILFARTLSLFPLKAQADALAIGLVSALIIARAWRMSRLPI